MNAKQSMGVTLGILVISAIVATAAEPVPGDAPVGDKAGGMMCKGGGCQPGMMGGGAPMGMMMNPLCLKQAGATDDQIKAVNAAKLEAEKQGVSMKAKGELAQIKMRELLAADTPDEKAILAAVDEVGAVRTEQMKAMISAQLKTREILGAEVYKKVQQMPCQMKAGMGRSRGKMGMAPGSIGQDGRKGGKGPEGGKPDDDDNKGPEDGGK